jgi:hypothetical protein
MGCGVQATLLHAGAAKDAALEKSLGKVVEVSEGTHGLDMLAAMIVIAMVVADHD